MDLAKEQSKRGMQKGKHVMQKAMKCLMLRKNQDETRAGTLDLPPHHPKATPSHNSTESTGKTFLVSHKAKAAVAHAKMNETKRRRFTDELQGATGCWRRNGNVTLLIASLHPVDKLMTVSRWMTEICMSKRLLRYRVHHEQEAKEVRELQARKSKRDRREWSNVKLRCRKRYLR